MVITTGYTVWMLMQKQQIGYEEKISMWRELARFEIYFRTDIDQGNAITLDRNSISCHSQKKRVYYDFFDDMIIRRSDGCHSSHNHRERPDTFLIATESPKLVDDVLGYGAKRLDIIIVEIGLQKTPYKIVVSKEIFITDG
jgi:hypothetical protein